MGPSLTPLSTTIDTRSCALAVTADAATASSRTTAWPILDRSLIDRRVYDARSGIARRGPSPNSREIHERAVACGGAGGQSPQRFVHAHDRERADRHRAEYARARDRRDWQSAAV